MVRAREQGFSAIEVLIAMTVMAVGAAAVMSMQKASIQGDLDARKMDIANAVAHTWVERIERDAMQWTLPSNAYPTAPSNINTAQLIANHLDKGWFLPNDYLSTQPDESYAFDILGRDLPLANMQNAVFCAAVQLTTLVTNQMFRVDVRVLWRTGLANGQTASSGGLCASADIVAADPNASGNGVPVYHGVYVTTSVRENAAR